MPCADTSPMGGGRAAVPTGGFGGGAARIHCDAMGPDGDLTATIDARSAYVLQCAAVVGADFWRGAVCAAAVGVTPAEVDAALWTLAARAVVRCEAGSRWRAEDTWRFNDPALAATAHDAMDPSQRARAHGAVARWLQDVGELDAAVIGRHLLQSDDRRAAAPWCAEAARSALAAKDYDGALAWSEHAIACGCDRATEAALRILQVSVHDSRGALEEADRCASLGFQVAPRGSPEWFRAASSVAVLAMRRLEPDRFRALAPALDEALRDTQGVAAAGLATALYPMLQAGQYALADLLLERLDEILASGEHPEPTFPARVYAARAIRANFGGDPRVFEEESRRAARAYETYDEPRFALIHWNNVGFAQLSLGDAERAAGTFRSVIDRATAQDFQRIVTSARHNLGLALLFQGRIAEASALEREVIAVAEAQGDAHTASLARLYLARAQLAGGAFAAARRTVDDALPALRSSPSGRVLGLAIRAQASIGAGDLAGAARDAADGTELLATVGTVEEGEGLLRLACAEALLAAGRTGEATRAVHEAWAWLQGRAARAGDARARQRFVEGVPEHARIAALAATYAGAGAG